MNSAAQLTLLMIFCAVAVLVIIEGIRIAAYMTISKRMTNSIKKFERRGPATAKRILFIGDSTGHGTGTSHERYSIVGRLGADFPDAHIENCSESGSHLARARRVLQEKIHAEEQRYDVVIIMLGGIDLTRFTPLWLVRSTLQKAVAYGKQCGREIILISPNNTGLAPLFRFPLSNLYQRRAKRFYELYGDVAREGHIRHVSLFRESADPLRIRHLHARDKTHPNDEGYGLWYNQMKDTIKSTMENHDGNISS